MDLQDKVSDQQGWMEWLVSKIPGYSGYKDKEMRREADVLLRDKVANKLHEQLTRAENITNQLLTGPGMGQLDEMGRGNTRLQTLIDKVKTAAQGYASFFDAVRIKEKELDTLYQFDYDMMMHAAEIDKALNALQTAVDSGENVAPAVRRYVTTVSDLSTLFDKRRETMVDMA